MARRFGRVRCDARLWHFRSATRRSSKVLGNSQWSHPVVQGHCWLRPYRKSIVPRRSVLLRIPGEISSGHTRGARYRLLWLGREAGDRAVPAGPTGAGSCQPSSTRRIRAGCRGGSIGNRLVDCHWSNRLNRLRRCTAAQVRRCSLTPSSAPTHGNSSTSEFLV